MSKENSEPRTLLGLLECPFRRGYIEFEYQQGDTIAELKKRVAKLWGSPVVLGESLDRNNWHGGLTDRGLWAILCEDESGAYLPLSNDRTIPTSPPKAGDNIKQPVISPNPVGRWKLPAGLIYDVDADADYLQVYEHLDLGLNREYQIPSDRTYAVKLIALIVITGG